jgi:double-stranded uracil-DNA glycosylase
VRDPTLSVYEASAARWTADREPHDVEGARAFGAAARAASLGPVADLGCGPGWDSGVLGPGTVALDGAGAMLDLVARRAPAAVRVQADLRALPFRRGSLGGGWASKSYVHLARAEVPMALWDLQRSLAVGSPVVLRCFAGDVEHGPFERDDFPGRSYSLWDPGHLGDVVAGAGFDVEAVTTKARSAWADIVVRATRARTLADTVGAGMRVLVCGLNPSLHAADAGVGYAGPGNRFWPAAVAAGLVTSERDPRRALVEDRVGMTDLVKRATPRAAELHATEHRAGVARLERLCAWLAPGAVCIVGLAGWRAAVDRRARPGWQERTLGGRPAYVMPSTSGLNAGTSLADLVEHLERVVAGS